MRAMTWPKRIMWIVIIAAVLVWSLFPVFSILMTSFKTPAGLFSGTLLPQEWTLDNYATILAPGGSAQDLFLPALRNSIGISLIATFIAVVLGSANVFGGFVVTDRMLEMFKRKPAAGKSAGAGGK